MEELSITHPDIEVEKKAPEEASRLALDKYRLRLIQARVKTEEDLSRMSEEEIKKLYLKHEQGVIENMSKQVHKYFVKGYTKLVSRVAPIKDKDQLELDLNEDVFLKAGIKEIFPMIYYEYGAYLAPLSILATTAAHIDSERTESIFPYTNEFETSQEESEETTTARAADK